MPRPLARPSLVLLLVACSVRAPELDPGPPLLLGRLSPRAAAELERCVRHEVDTKDLGALSIAVVDGGSVTWAMGYGWIDPERAPEPGRATAEDVEQCAARVDTLYRVGSVTKLFTDVALMRLVEEGRVRLDAPVRDYLPDFLPENPFGGEITLRQLASHRSGLVREPPVGSYFDPDEPSLTKTVKSLNRTRLVAAPGTVTKYSNAGLAVLGRVIESVEGRPFADVLRTRVLLPLGLEDPRLAREPWMARRTAHGRMWTYDGRTFPAPEFELSGMAPAGNLYASMLDLAKFATVAMGTGAPAEPLLARASWEAMMQPTLAADGAPTGFGIGFALGELDGARRCGHGGAVYGFSTELAFLPDERVAVAVACSLDVSNAVTRRLADHALRVVLAARKGREIPRLELGEPVEPRAAHDLVGHYRAESGETADLRMERGGLVLEWRGLLRALRAHGEELRVDDRHAFGPRVAPLPGGELEIDGVPYRRASAERPPPCPPELAPYLGDYGWDHDVLTVRERDGALEALIEWFWLDRLTPDGPDRFALPAGSGLYPLEHVTFERDGDGAVTALQLGPVRFPRRPESRGTFRIEPLRPIAELAAAARALEAPTGIAPEGRSVPSDLVDLQRVVPDLRCDVRYAGTDNFLGLPVYPVARAFLQRPAAEALARVQQDLRQEGLALLVHDAYRPWSVTRVFWDATPPELRGFVADPSEGSRHNRGCAVDLSLFDVLADAPVAMPSGYDEFTPRAYPAWPGGTSLQRWLRDRLRSAMEREGFEVYPQEWWHFDFRGWEHYAIENQSLEAL